MKKHNIYLLVFLFTGIQLSHAENKIRTDAQVDQIMKNIPVAFTFSTEQIAEYINSNFLTEDEKSRAIFYWIGNNIQYDLDNMYSFDITHNNQKNSDDVLKSRHGICNDYVLLFKNIADQVGLRSFVVTGYTKKNGHVNGNPHAWIAVNIDSVWYLTDPTWGSGYIEGKRYIKNFNYDFFRVKPERFIKSHIPFDPIWQLLDYPITKQEFNSSKRLRTKNTSFCNYNDSILKQLSRSRIQRLESMRDHAMSNGIANYLDHDHLVHLQSKITYYYCKKNENHYYSALTNYNKGIQQLNEYIVYKNKYYLPFKSDSAIKHMLIDIEGIFDTSLGNLMQIDKSSAVDELKNQLNESVSKAKITLNNEQAELHKYLETAKVYRANIAQDMKREQQ